MRLIVSLCLVSLLLDGCGAIGLQRGDTTTPMISIDEIGADHATVAVLSAQEGQARLALNSMERRGEARETVIALGSDAMALWRLDSLAPDTNYRLSWEIDTGSAITAAGFSTFATTPPASRAVPVRFVFGGDLGGQNACRDRRRGYPVFDAMSRYRPDFFVALGDMIYADDVCKATGVYGNPQVPGAFPPSTAAGDFEAHWLYQHRDEGLASFRAATPWYTTWDDHEVLNDFDPSRDFRPEAPQQRLLEHGRAASARYGALPTPQTYRSVRWGTHLEVFILDTRSHRQPNDLRDDGVQPKTMLGRQQRDWLIGALTSSDATWKVIASSVPLAIPTGNAQADARDGWANGDSVTGFERELLQILAALADAELRNLVVISADVHFATVLRHTVPDTGLQLHEFVVGPLNAGIYPKRELDPTLNTERLFFFGPPSAKSVVDFDAAMDWFNFGLIDIAADGALRSRIVNARRAEVYELRLRPSM